VKEENEMMRKYRLWKRSSKFLWLMLCIFLFSISITYAGVNGETKGGEDWINIGLTDLEVYSLIMDSLTPTIIYARAGDGIFKSTDGGDSWTQVNNGLTDLTIYTLAIDPITPTTIYAGTWDGIFKTTNGGKSWMNIGLTDLEVYGLIIDLINPTTIYAGTDEGIFKMAGSPS